MARDSKYMEYMMTKTIINVNMRGKKSRSFFMDGVPNDECDAKANNHELGQKALSFWEREKRARNCVRSFS